MIAWLLSEAWPYILGAAGVIASLFLARQSGKRAAKNEQAQSDLDATLQSKRNYEKISQMDDDSQLAEFDRLRAKRRKLL